ncbi:MAG: LicD family protein [Caldilineaceae bacterium]|nr:LicD family protein [Caldilineaceae bacterium]
MTSSPPIDVTPDEDFYRTHFPDLRETGETPLRQCQLVMIRMLRIFDYLCRRHAIPYWISDGTLLGAVRHQGFIPWDCDVDVSMRRADRSRFVQAAAPDLPADMFLQTPESDPGCGLTHIFKLRDRYSCYVAWERRYQAAHPGHCGLMVDIWSYDLQPTKLMADLMNLRAQQQRTEKSSLFGHGGYHQLSNEQIFPLVYLPFEGMQLPAPRDYAGHLRFHYGDYMQLPPEADRRPRSGEADAFTPSNHPASLRWEERKGKGQNPSPTRAMDHEPAQRSKEESAQAAGFRRNLQLLHDTLAGTPLAERYWVWGGLLIGWAREGRILSHDANDADFAFLRRDRAHFLAAIPALTEVGFVPTLRWTNNAGAATEYVFRKDGASFEFFEMAEEGDAFCYWLYRSGVEYACRIPRHDLSPMTFLDRTWLKPADHDKILTAIYGDWRVPDPRWSFTQEKSIVEQYYWVGTRIWRSEGEPLALTWLHSQTRPVDDSYPPVSCICPTYARTHLLNEAIFSFLLQDYPGRKEMIVLNDYGEQTLEFEHPEVCIVNRAGQFSSIGEKYAAAVELAAYDLLFVWHDDDIYLPHRLRYCVERFDPAVGFFKPGRAWFWNDGALSGPVSNVLHGNSCWSRSLYHKAGGYPHQDLGYDAEFEQRIAAQGEGRGALAAPIETEEIFYIYRWTGTGAYHLSALQTRLAVASHTERMVQCGRAPQGRIALQPGWRVDYRDLVRNGSIG